MARKKKDDTIERNEIILQKPMEDIMRDSMIPYAEHVILERALPRVEDGLKPVQRRILYSMLELGNTPDKPYRKCARIVGDCLGRYRRRHAIHRGAHGAAGNGAAARLGKRHGFLLAEL